MELCEAGFGQQGAMLNRSLFETVVDAYWVASNKQLAQERYQDHRAHHNLLNRAVLEDASEASDQHGTRDAERQRLARLYGRFGERSWTGVGLYERVRAI